MTPRSALGVHERDERPTTADAIPRPRFAWRRRVAALFLGGLVAAVASASATAQTTTLSGTTTGIVPIQATSGAPTIVGNSVLTGTASFVFAGEYSGNATGTMTSNLSGTGSLAFIGPGTLVMTGTSSYGGGTSVASAGVIEVTTGGSISHTASDLLVGVGGGSASFTLSGGSVGVRSATIGSGYGVNSTLAVSSGTWSGSGGLTVASAGATGLFLLDGGSVTVSSATIGAGKSDIGDQPASSGSAVVNGGTWTTTNGLAIGAGEGNGSLTISGGAVNSGSGTIGGDFGTSSDANVTGGTWTNGGDLTVGGIGSGTLSIGGGGTVVVGGTLFQGTGGTINLSGGTLQIGNGGNSGAAVGSLTTNGTLVFNRSGIYDHPYEIDGDGSVVKEGSGTLILSTNNFWNGGTAINGGVLEVGASGAIGSNGTISFGGGTLRFSSSDTTDYSGRLDTSGNQQFKLDTNNETVTLGSVIAGSGSTLEKLGGGSLILAADNTYDGPTTVSGGTLQIGAGGTSGAIAGDLVNNAAVAFDRSNDLTVAGGISGTGSLETTGGGVVTFTGTNTYTGATTLSAGTLSLGSATALGATSSIAFNGGTLRFTTANHADPSAAFSTADGQSYKLDTNGQNVTLARSLASAGSTLEKFGAGTLTLTGNNTFAGGTTLSGGVLSLAGTGALGDPNDAAAGTISFAGGTLGYTANNQSDYSSRFSTAAGQAFSIDTNGQTVTFATDLTSSNATLAKLGQGTLALTGENDLGGGVSLDGGTLRLGSTGAIGASGPIQFHGGTLQFTTVNTTDVSARISSAAGQAFSIDADGADVTFATVLQGNGNTLTKLGSGVLTLAGDNLYSGVTTVSAGTLRLGDGGTSGMVAGDIVNNATLVFDRSDAPTYSGVISGTGALTMDGQGTLTLTGANTYSGATTLLRGTLALGSADALGQTSSLRFDGGGLQYTSGVTTDVSGLIATSANQPINIDTNGENVVFATGLSGAGSSLAKYGTGTLTLSGASSYTGGTTVGGGTLEVASGGAIAHDASDLFVRGGTLSVTGGTVSVHDATLADGAGADGTLSVSAGSLNAAGTLRVGSGASATGTLDISGGTVTTGATIVGDQSSTGTVTVSGGTWNNSGDLSVTVGTVTIAGGTVTVGGTLSESAPGSVDLQAGGQLRIGSGGAGGVLQADLDFDGDLVFDSSGDHDYGGTLAGTGTLEKQGSGLLTLTNAGTYTYSGQTTVSSGGLVIDGSLDNSSVVVDAGGLLGGSGTVVGAVTVNSGATIAPGVDGVPGLFTVGSLSLQGGSQTSFGILGDGNLAGVAGTNYGQLRITDTPVDLAGTLRLDFGNGSPFANGEVFQLFAFDGGSPIGHLSSVIAAGTGVYSHLTFQSSGTGEWTSSLSSGEQFLRFSELTGRLEVVPEPSTWGMLLAGSAAGVIGGLRRRRLRKHQKTLGM